MRGGNGTPGKHGRAAFLVNWAASLACATALNAPAAQAGMKPIKVCNDFTVTVYFALAYQQPDRSWVSRGWLDTRPGTCRVVDSLPSLEELYWRAQTGYYRDKASKDLVITSWGNDRQFPIAYRNPFSFQPADTSAPGAVMAGFTRESPVIRGGDLVLLVTIKANGTFESAIAPWGGEVSR